MSESLPPMNFDAEFYIASNPDVAQNEIDPLAHYNAYGWIENRNPCEGFDVWFYKVRYPEFSKEYPEPLAHYNNIGRHKGYSGLPLNGRSADTIDIRSLDTCKVAIHCHVSEVSLWPETCDVLATIRRPVTLYLTTRSRADYLGCLRYMEKFPDFDVSVVSRIVPDGVHNLGALLHHLADEHHKFDVWAHTHTKYGANPAAGEQRVYQLARMFGSGTLVDRYISLLTDPDGRHGFIWPDNLRHSKDNLQSERFDKTSSRPAAAVFAPSREYPIESFFWASAKALEVMSLCELLENEMSSSKIDPDRHERDVMATLCNRLGEEGITFTVVYPGRNEMAKTATPAACAKDHADPQGERWRPMTPEITDCRQLPLSRVMRPVNSAMLDLHWVIPDFSEGGGGHMTIFRFVKLFESYGFRQTVWLQYARNHRNPAAAKDNIKRWYQPISDQVIVRYLPDDVEAIEGDAVIATDCWSAFPVSRMTRFKERFYFIQDWETEFHPAGDLRLAAQATYGFGFTALAAGDWLAGKAAEAGMDVVKWPLGADKIIYDSTSRSPSKAFAKDKRLDLHNFYKAVKTRSTASKTDPSPENVFLHFKNGIPWQVGNAGGSIPQIAVYARGHTPRRAVDLAIAGLMSLAQRGWLFHVHFYGEEKDFGELPFLYTPHGLLKPKQLRGIYDACDLGLAFSCTNYSLVPLEMMACGLPVVEIDTESTRAAYPEGAVARAMPVAHAVADEIEALFLDPGRRDSLVTLGNRFVADADWEKSVDLVAREIRQRVVAKSGVDVAPILANLRKQNSRVDVPSPAILTRPVASIFIPTFNAGEDFDIVLQAIAEQKMDTPFELVVIDSGSTDGTLDLVSRWKDRIRINLQTIRNTEFGHGRTRNQGIALSEGDFVAILTQDACPASPYWLRYMISGFNEGDSVAGVFGRHIAYPMHSLFEAPGMDAFFDGFRMLGALYSMDGAMPGYVYRGSPAWQSALQFYSDNNSCLRKSVWDAVPYDDVLWGEDQVWAWQIARLGFQKAYAHDAAVYHSHDYTSRKLSQVGSEEGRMFLEHFGMYIGLDADKRGSDRAISDMIENALAADRAILEKHGVAGDESLLLRRAVQHLALQRGRSRGVTDMKRKLRQ